MLRWPPAASLWRSELRRLEDFLSDHRTFLRGEWRGLMVLRQLHRISERRNKDFAIGTGAQMTAKFGADVGRQLIVDVSGQLPENIQAMSFARLVMRG